MSIREEISELVRGDDRRVERPTDAAETVVTSEDITNLRNAVASFKRLLFGWRRR